jgi:hypothetical protein
MSQIKNDIDRGTVPLAVANQNAGREAILKGTPVAPIAKAAPEQPAAVAPRPVLRRPYDVTLTYTPSAGVKAPGFSVSFKARAVDVSQDQFISIDHGPDMNIAFTELSEDLTLKIGSTIYPVSWIGSTFRFPDNDVFGIQLLRRDKIATSQ